MSADPVCSACKCSKLKLLLKISTSCCVSEGGDQVNGFSSRSSRAERRRARHSSGSDPEHSDNKENMASADETDQSLQPGKLSDASEEENTSEHKTRSRTSKRAAVIQSSSESEEHDHEQQGTASKKCFYSVFFGDLNRVFSRTFPARLSNNSTSYFHFRRFSSCQWTQKLQPS